MRVSDLRDRPVVDATGKHLGRVHEVHCEGGAITALACGAGSLIERLTARRSGRVIRWDQVDRLEKGAIMLRPD